MACNKITVFAGHFTGQCSFYRTVFVYHFFGFWSSFLVPLTLHRPSGAHHLAGDAVMFLKLVCEFLTIVKNSRTGCVTKCHMVLLRTRAHGNFFISVDFETLFELRLRTKTVLRFWLEPNTIVSLSVLFDCLFVGCKPSKYFGLTKSHDSRFNETYIAKI